MGFWMSADAVRGGPQAEFTGEGEGTPPRGGGDGGRVTPVVHPAKPNAPPVGFITP